MTTKELKAAGAQLEGKIKQLVMDEFKAHGIRFTFADPSEVGQVALMVHATMIALGKTMVGMVSAVEAAGVFSSQDVDELFAAMRRDTRTQAEELGGKVEELKATIERLRKREEEQVH